MNSLAATERDAKHLFRAIELALRARGLTSPNPLVGAVVLKGGKVIGEGWHEAAGEPHAERAAHAPTAGARRPTPSRSASAPSTPTTRCSLRASRRLRASRAA